ncbi:unnamed protein product, partial [Ixodes hexagonus]
MERFPRCQDEVTQFRLAHANTFAALCKMHLSFVLDMQYKISKVDTQSIENNLPLTEPKNVCDEVRLTPEVARSIQLIVDHLREEENIRTEGLFRKSGSFGRQQTLKALLIRGLSLDFKKEGYSVHDCACVLKRLLAELSEPLLASEMFSAYCKIPGLCRARTLPSVRAECLKRQLKAAQLLLLLLPPLNYCIASELLVLLHEVSNAREANRMTTESLALLFTPVIFCPREMSPEEIQEKSAELTKPLTFLIENAHAMLNYPAELVKDVMNCIKQHHGTPTSSSEGSDIEPVRTAVAFCVQQKPKEEAVKAYTERALAELYDYINGMPETRQKKRFVKQVYKENAGDVSKIRRKHGRSKSAGAASNRHDLLFFPLSSLAHARLKSQCCLLHQQSPDQKLAKDTTGKRNILTAPWRFLKRKHDKECSSLPVTPTDVHPKKSGPLGKSILRASRRVK